MSETKTLPNEVRMGNTVQVRIGIIGGTIALTVGSTSLSMSPEMAEQMAGDLMRFALESRNGGQLG